MAAVACIYFGVMIYTILTSLKKDETLLGYLRKFVENHNKRITYLESTLDKLVNGRISAFEQRLQYLEQQAQLNQIGAAAAIIAKAKTHHEEADMTPATAAVVAVELDETILTQYFAKDTTVHPSLVFHHPSKNNHNNHKPSKPIQIRNDVYVLSISSMHKRELQAAQRETFGQVFTMVFVEEAHTPVCVRCAVAGERNNLGNNLGWNCAQQRTLQALRLFMSQWRYWVNTLSWLMIVDDDTFINHVALVRIIDGMDPRTMFVKVTKSYSHYERHANTHNQHTQPTHHTRSMFAKVTYTLTHYEDLHPINKQSTNTAPTHAIMTPKVTALSTHSGLEPHILSTST